VLDGPIGPQRSEQRESIFIAGLVVRADTGRVAGRGKLTKPAIELIATLGTQIKLPKARDSKPIGMVERMNRWFHRRFMSGQALASAEDFTQQAAGWLLVAINRMSRVRCGRPVGAVAVDQDALFSLPPVAPEVMFRNVVRLPRE
jgi:hypothetical protein